MKIGKKFILDLERFNPLKELNLYKNQLLFLQGDQDICIDINEIKNIYQKMNNQNKLLKIIKGGGHGFKTEPYTSHVAKLITQFIQNNL